MGHSTTPKQISPLIIEPDTQHTRALDNMNTVGEANPRTLRSIEDSIARKPRSPPSSTKKDTMLAYAKRVTTKYGDKRLMGGANQSTSDRLSTPLRVIRQVPR